MKYCLVFVLFFAPSFASGDAKKVFVFSGYKSSTSKSLYQDIGTEFGALGIEPEFIEIDWSKGSIVDYIAQARLAVQAKKGTENYFYGFSVGGLIALAISAEIPSEAVIVSSLAPFFEENLQESKWYSLHKIYNWWLFGSSESISQAKVISEINSSDTKVVLLVGDRERANMKRVSSEFVDSLQDHGQLIVMDDIGHGLSIPGHMTYITEEIKKLSSIDD